VDEEHRDEESAGDDQGDDRLRIPADGVAILDLLLRGGLCSTHLWEGAIASLPEVERAETLDALSQGAWPLPQLTWEWGGTVGEVDTLVAGGQDVNLTGFYDSLNSLAAVFDLQISVPVIGDVHNDVELMPPFPGQRMHLINRSDWMDFGPYPDGVPEEGTEMKIPSDIPVFTDPAIRIGERRVGEVWVRLHPDQIAGLKESPEDLFNLLIWLADTRVFQLRETLRRRQLAFKEDDLATLIAQVDVVSSWQRVLRYGMNVFQRLSPDERVAKLPGLLEIATGHWRKDQKPVTLTPPLTVFVSYTHESESHNVWVRRLANGIEEFAEFHVLFDGYDLHAGKDLTHFMERSLAADRVVVVITAAYVDKATKRDGGVGYESSVISAELLDDQLADRFVPVLREGLARPAFLRSKVYVDFRDDNLFEEALLELRAALLHLPTAQRPPKKQ
jgi:hypothetical protein